MKFKLFIGLFLALLLGLSIGFGARSAILFAGNFYDNNFSKYINLDFISIGPDLKNKSMGGPENHENIKLIRENFPGNYSEEFDEKKEKLSQEDFEITKEGKSIVVDLEQMRIQTFENGNRINDYEVLGIGKPGTAWETPPGKYNILYKKENHFSSIGKVWMPFSMQFFGNYFIHGWPYYSDGTPVAPGYSGGCIRVANEDMEKIYNFTDIDTEVIIKGSLSESDKNPNNGSYKLFDDYDSFPNLSSDAYLVADIETGEIIESYGQKAQYPVASLTKLITSLTSLETVNQYSETRVSHNAYSTYGSQGNLYTGEKYEIGDLLYPLLLESSNDAAEVIAEFAGRDYFISNMNKKAKSIGLKNSNFADPSGLSENNISTAEDLFQLTQYIYKYKSYIFDLTQYKKYEFRNKIWNNNSRFKSDENYIGGKNGYTDEARYTIISLFDLPLGEFENRKIAIILLHSDEIESDVRRIVYWLLNNIYFEEESQLYF